MRTRHRSHCCCWLFVAARSLTGVHACVQAATVLSDQELASGRVMAAKVGVVAAGCAWWRRGRSCVALQQPACCCCQVLCCSRRALGVACTHSCNRRLSALLSALDIVFASTQPLWADPVRQREGPPAHRGYRMFVHRGDTGGGGGSGRGRVRALQGADAARALLSRACTTDVRYCMRLRRRAGSTATRSCCQAAPRPRCRTGASYQVRWQAALLLVPACWPVVLQASCSWRTGALPALCRQQ